MPRSPTNPNLNSSVEKLAPAIGQATRSVKFVISGCIPVVDPGLVAEGLGRVAVPLKCTAAKSLIAACQVAPFGKGTETLVDTRVRKTFELDAQRFQLDDKWNSAIAEFSQGVTQRCVPSAVSMR